MRTITVTALAVPLVAAVAVGGTAHAGSSSERFSVVSTTTQGSPVYSVVATGLFTAGGTASHTGSDTVTLQLPAGSITLHTIQTHRRETTTETATACLQNLHTDGDYTIVGGTGSYAGITGSGQSSTDGTFVERREAGSCSSTYDAVQVIITAAGPVSLH